MPTRGQRDLTITLELSKSSQPAVLPALIAASSDLFKDPASATSDQRPFCSMGHSDGRSNSFKFGLEGLLEIGHARTETKSRFVVGKNGSKVELIE